VILAIARVGHLGQELVRHSLMQAIRRELGVGWYEAKKGGPGGHRVRLPADGASGEKTMIGKQSEGGNPSGS
jgi:hypothetical protein